jgi:alpha-glucosidase
MLCDAPSVYERETEIMGFISHIPTVWDETKVLDAKFGEYIVEARQTGKTWYIAGMNGEKLREVNLDFSLLGEGTFTAQILKDGPNADRVGTDYLFEIIQVTKNSKLTVKMVKGGGFIICIK